MSQKAHDELQRIREEALHRQVLCAWCGKLCKHADHLFIHILLNHPMKGQDE